MDKKEPLLSIVVPIYNAEKYLKQCVESILKQNYMTIEIVLVDDGSSDQSGLVCDCLAERNSCIKVLHIENGGITKARLAGVKASVADMVTFVDADDWIEENAYKDLPFDGDNDVIITGIYRYIDPEHITSQLPYLEEGIYDGESIINRIAPVMLWTPELGYWALDPSLCTKVFKRKIVLEQLEMASEVGSNYAEDSMVIFPLILRADRIQIVNKIYYYHRQRISERISPYIKDEEFLSKLGNVYEYLKRQFKRMHYWSIMKEQLDCFLISSTDLKKSCYNYQALKFVAHFPVEKIHQDSSIVLYGAGNLGRQYWQQNIMYHFCNIKLWVDKNHEKLWDNNVSIQDPEIIREIDFDYVLIAVDDYCAARDIACYLKGMGVEKEKVVWHSARINEKGFEEL